MLVSKKRRNVTCLVHSQTSLFACKHCSQTSTTSFRQPGIFRKIWSISRNTRQKTKFTFSNPPPEARWFLKIDSLTTIAYMPLVVYKCVLAWSWKIFLTGLCARGVQGKGIQIAGGPDVGCTYGKMCKVRDILP